MKLGHLKFLMAFAVIAVASLLAACSEDSSRESSDTPSEKTTVVTETVCVDEETELEMPCDALKALKNERQKRSEAEDAARAAEARTAESGTDSGGQAAAPAAPEVPAAPEADKTGTRNGFFEEKELGFRIPIGPRGTVQKREVPEIGWEPGPRDPNIDTYYSIGYYAMRPEAFPGTQFTIVVEEMDKDLLDGSGYPKYAPSEGGPSPDTIDIPHELKGFLYSSNAMGAFPDAHITIYRQRRIYYLREAGRKEEVSERLKNFARTFEVLEG